MIPPVRKKVTVSTLVLESSLWKLSPSAKDALRVTLTSARVTLHMELLSNITSTWGSTGTGCSTIVPADWTRASVAFPDQSSKIYTFAVAFESHKLLICSIPGAVSTQVRTCLIRPFEAGRAMKQVHDAYHPRDAELIRRYYAEDFRRFSYSSSLYK